MPRMTKAQKQAEKERREARLAEARAIVATGKCPVCSTPLIRNNAMAGWWQCGGYACEAFRKTEFKGLPSCSFQTFTE